MELGYDCMYLSVKSCCISHWIINMEYLHIIQAYLRSEIWGSLWPAPGGIHPQYDQGVRGEGLIGNIPWFLAELESILSTVQRTLAGADSRARRSDISINFGVLTVSRGEYSNLGESHSPRPWSTTYSTGNITLWMAGYYGEAEQYTRRGRLSWITSSIRFLPIHMLNRISKLSSNKTTQSNISPC